MKFRAMMGLALEGLFRKKGRNFLTMSGVLIGVMALTTIVALGEGLTNAMTSTVSGEDNLRQLMVTGGFGIEQTNDPFTVEIKGNMTDARRERMRRAAVNRRTIRQIEGRRLKTINEASMRVLENIPHVERVTPLLIERYEIELGEYSEPAKMCVGVDIERQRYAPRVIAGSYFSSEDANEVILHEYLLYQWGMLTDGDYEKVLGKKVTLRGLVNEDQLGTVPPQMQEMFKDLNEEEKKAMQVLLPKLMQMAGQFSGERQRVEQEFTLVGVIREAEPDDVFNIVEDGNSVQTDIFLPQETAKSLFLQSLVNQELGFPRAMVTIDDSANAKEVEQALRDKGYTAFSVATVMDRLQTVLNVITVVVAFLTGIALLVATLGIVNTMITSVLERTREIGIFKAVGATNGQVMLVFLTESALIGLLGGLLGLGVSLLAMIPGDMIAKSIISSTAAVPFKGDVFIVPLWLAFAGPALGTFTAILAAVIPARRASRIDPVRALRTE
ncbi:ABC transporter permease [Planctomycetota bacterium]|nr:ABC transporter permease [Planctomycetota bacterium]